MVGSEKKFFTDYSLSNKPRFKFTVRVRREKHEWVFV